MKLWRGKNRRRNAAERILWPAVCVAPAVMGICVSTAAIAESPARHRPRRVPPVETASAEIRRAASEAALAIDTQADPKPQADLASQAVGANQKDRRFSDLRPDFVRSPDFLRSSGSELYLDRATEAFEQARRLYFKAAFASAESSAWDSLTAAAVEISRRYPDHPYGDPVESLRIARTAMTEARDFGGRFDAQDTAAITRMVRSHRTETLKGVLLNDLSMVDASDAYLDDARKHLAVLSTQSVMAARAMDLLAAILLSRDDNRVLPSSSAICLRRAALQGQPGNASLAQRLAEHLDEVGLRREANHVFAHAKQIAPQADAANPLPLTIQTVSPEAFAAMSRPASPTRNRVASRSSASIPVQSVSHRTSSTSQSATGASTVPSPTLRTPQAPESSNVNVQESFWSRAFPSFLRRGGR